MAVKLFAFLFIAMSMSTAPSAAIAKPKKATPPSKTKKLAQPVTAAKAPPGESKSQVLAESQDLGKKLILDLRRADAQCKVQFTAKAGPLKILNLQESWHFEEGAQEVRVESGQAGTATSALQISVTGTPREFALMGNSCQVQMQNWAAPGSIVLKDGVVNLSGPLKDLSVYLISGEVVAKQTTGHLLVSSEKANLVGSDTKGLLELHSQSGTIKVSDHSGRLHLKQATGSAVLKDIDGELQLDLIKGNLVLTDPQGSVFIESAEANVKVQLAKSDAQMQIKNSKGRISVNLNGKSAWVDVLSQDGEISPPGSVGLKRAGAEKIAKGRTTGTSSKSSLVVRSKAGSIFVR